MYQNKDQLIHYVYACVSISARLNNKITDHKHDSHCHCNHSHRKSDNGIIHLSMCNGAIELKNYYFIHYVYL